jgi:hypothetical protein
MTKRKVWALASSDAYGNVSDEQNFVREDK